MRILVALDFSDCSKLACEWATRYVAHMGPLAGEGTVVDVVFLHVLDSVPPGEGSQSARLNELERDVDQLRSLVEGSCAEPLPATVSSRYTVTRGKAADEILSVARAHSVDAIIMGTHGRKGMNKLLLGSVAEKVVREAPCTVITVKAKATLTHTTNA